MRDGENFSSIVMKFCSENFHDHDRVVVAIADEWYDDGVRSCNDEDRL